MEYMVKISVVLATYNGKKYVEKQLDSIRKQSRKPDEVIIVDDYSIDGTVDYIQHYIEKFELSNWKAFYNEENLGYKKNFYEGLKKATGEYVFLSDQDDEWNENKIEQMISVMDKETSLLSLSCAVQIIDEDSREVDVNCESNYYNSNFMYLDHKPEKLEYFDLAYITKHNISPGCTTVVRRELINKFIELYDFELPHDWFLNMLAASENGCGYLNEKLIRYRIHGKNAIGANTNPVEGMRRKTRDVRIQDYEARNHAIDKIVPNNKKEKVNSVVNLNNEMISFYRKPTVIKLIRLRKKAEYYELAKRKVRIWEWVVSLGLDGIIVKILK